MNAEKVEGTLVLDGLLQGRLAAGDGTAERLQEWVKFVGTLGPRFSLEIRDSSFSLLPDNSPVAVTQLGDAPEETLGQAIEQLVELFPGPERYQLFSTLRSSEFRKGEEVQTIYAIADGAARTQSRTVAAQTTPPPQPVSLREQLKLGALSLVTVAAVLGIALLFPGVRAMFGQVVDTVRPFHAEELKLDAGPYQSLLSCKIDESRSDRTALVLKFERGDAFPATDAAFEKLLTEATAATQRLALENLLRGYVRVELYDAEGKYVGTGELRVQELRKEKSINVAIPLPAKIRIQQVRLAL